MHIRETLLESTPSNRSRVSITVPAIMLAWLQA